LPAKREEISTMDKQEILKAIAFNVVQGRVEAEDEGFDDGLEGQPGVTELVNEALDKGVEPKEIVIESLTKSMEEVGEKFERDEYLIPDMLASAECVGVAMDILSPHLMKAGVKSKGKFVIATVAGDLHDIGKNIVAIMLKGAGYQIIDLGTDVSADRIIGAVKENEAPFIGLSALLTTTMRVMGEVVKKLEQEGLRDRVKVLIGGAPTSTAFAEEIGADAYCKDAFDAIDVLKTMAI
jgi:5-methyltetrahydrofolate--homocysteine methyltransferase